MRGLLVSRQKCNIRCRTAEETRVKEKRVDCKAELWILLGKIQDKSRAGGLPVWQKEKEQGMHLSSQARMGKEQREGGDDREV